MDISEFKNKVLPSRDKLWRFARRLLGNEEEAEDTIQDVFLKLWDIRHQITHYNSIEALAMKMTKNQCLDKLKSKRNMQVNLDNHSSHLLSGFAPPDKKTELNDSMDIMSLAIQTLPENQKMIIQLRDIEEYEFEEIAEILGFDLNYIRVNLSRARKKIREILTKVYNYGT